MTSLAGIIKWLIRDAVCMALYYSGAVHFLRWRRRRQGRGRLVVLGYHGVRELPSYIEMFCSPDLFRAQMRYIRKHYDATTLDAALARVRQPGWLSARDQVVVTFDDGYEDNYTTAWPIMREAGVPLHIFITTDCVSQQRATFVMALMLALEQTRCSSVALEDYGLGRIPLQTARQRDEAVRKIDGYAKPLGAVEREQVLDVVYERLQVDPRLRASSMLTWQQVREMARGGVFIGAHTRSHPVLAGLPMARLEDEIAGSRRDIERHIDAPVRYFAYPYGGRRDLDDAAVEEVRRAGYDAAVVLHERPEDGNAYRIGRTMLTRDRVSHPWGGFSPAMFACEIEGIAQALFRRGGPSGGSAATARTNDNLTLSEAKP